ncbi:hypothetical protein RIF29_19911 [Crotalaria pallida]|uniref:Uncharacterized protein n=1 Tax=Crotalaria pallida TaxID=3830 RepID=A0AAN9F221_CROPI
MVAEESGAGDRDEGARGGARNGSLGSGTESQGQGLASDRVLGHQETFQDKKTLVRSAAAAATDTFPFFAFFSVIPSPRSSIIAFPPSEALSFSDRASESRISIS